MQSLLILGRQPALGLAELESRFGADALTPVGLQAALLDVPTSEVRFTLGGSMKLAKVIATIPAAQWPKIVNHIEKELPRLVATMPEGKIKFGISAYEIDVDGAAVSRSALRLKKIVKSCGRSVRVIPNNEKALNSAQVLYNQLTSPLGIELVVVRHGHTAILAQTVAEQDIDAYAARDQGRPKRDSKVGMLPPKLAQIIINLAGSHLVDGKKLTPEQIDYSKAGRITKLLDPFCGTGVILQEALLMGFEAYGTDLETRMIEYSKNNMEWLAEKLDEGLPNYNLSQGDATKFSWEPFDVIACETYLGRPFSSQPEASTLQEVMQDVNHIHKKFLQNVARQTPPGFKMCIAVPAWKTPQGFKHLKTLDILDELGYNRIEFVHARQEDIIYHREGQVVARELVVLSRI